MLYNKSILIVNQYASTPETAMGGRHYYLAKEFARLGHQVFLVASAYTHLLRNPKKIDKSFLIEKVENNFSVIWVKMPYYPHAHSKQRIMNEILFSWKIRGIKSILPVKPDIVYHSAPAVLSYFGAKHLADYYKIPYVFEERDIWPLTLVELGGYSPNHPFIRLLQWTQDQAYQNSKFFLSNLYNAVEHLELRGGDRNKFHWIPNGVFLSEMENREDVPSEIIDKIPKDKFIVGYTGTLGTANAIDSLLFAAEKLVDNQNICFVLVGGGRQAEELQAFAQSNQLNNVIFIDSISKTQVQTILQYFDTCFVGSQYSSLYRFGASPNKVPEYLYAAKPIIYAISDKDNIVKQINAGICVESENVDEFTQAILTLYNMSTKERREMGLRGKNFVVDNLDYSILANKLVTIFFDR